MIYVLFNLGVRIKYIIIMTPLCINYFSKYIQFQIKRDISYSYCIYKRICTRVYIIEEKNYIFYNNYIYILIGPELLNFLYFRLIRYILLSFYQFLLHALNAQLFDSLPLVELVLPF